MSLLGAIQEDTDMSYLDYRRERAFVAVSCFQKHENVGEFHNHGCFPGAQDSGHVQHWHQQRGKSS